MANVNFVKVVNNLPTTLEYDTLYFVKSGSLVNAFITNRDGSVTAYPVTYDQPLANINDAGLMPAEQFVKLSDLPDNTGLTTMFAGKQKVITQSSTPPANPQVGDLWIPI